MPGGIKSDSRPNVEVGTTWNLEFSIDTNGRAKLGRALNGAKNFFVGQQEAIIVQICTDISPDELRVVSEKNIIPYRYFGQKPYYAGNDKWYYIYCFSPKQENQQLGFQFTPLVPSKNHEIVIVYYYIDNADPEIFSKDVDFTDLTSKKNKHGDLIYDFKRLSNSDVAFTFDVQ